MIDKNTLLDTEEARLEAYDEIAQKGGSVADVQIIHEMSGIDEGVKRYRATLKDDDTRLADTAAGRKIFREVMKLLVPAIADAQNHAADGIANAGKGIRPVWWWYIQKVQPEKLALITIRALLSKHTKPGTIGRPATGIYLQVGLAVRQQVEFEQWQIRSRSDSKANGTPDVAARLLAKAKNFNQRQFNNWQRKLDSIIKEDWPREVRMHLGAKLVDLVICNTGGFFQLRYVQGGGKTQRQIFLSPECEAMIEDLNSRVECATPVQKPMITEPLPWTWNAKLNNYEGGYHMLKNTFITGGMHSHTASLVDPISETTLRAADSLGSVPYRVDTDVLDVAREVYERGLDIVDYLPKPDPQKLPEKLGDEAWEKMTKPERAEYKYTLSKIHDKNASEVSKRASAIRKFHICYNHSDLDVFHPVKMDTRSRFYYMTPDWNPQGDGLARGTTRFSNGVELGPRGLYWLAVRMCNTFGNDKISFDAMQVWASENHDAIVDSALNTFDGWRLWAEADSPLEFLQTCNEWASATACDNPEKFKSTLPIHQDGSNNGLQILSLLGRDPVGAQLTNCSAEEARFDIYGETAKLVQKMIVEDIRNGERLEEAQRWVGKITRAHAKKATMTTPYGVTPRGIQDQLINDGFLKSLDGNVVKNAGYLRDKLVAALEETVVASRPLMNYFQNVSAALCEHGIPMKWKTPADSLIQQSYWNVNKSDVKTVIGSVFLWDENPLGGLNLNKQRLAASPNVIHSLDAALMQKMIVSLKADGITDVCAIHDSFAVHPAHVDHMRDTIRNTAAEMFSGDWINDEFHPFVESYACGAELPEPPKQSTFDPQEVREAPYFFA